QLPAPHPFPTRRSSDLAVLGDGKCKVAVAGFTVSTTVTDVTNNQTFKAAALTQDAGWFTGGEVIWTSGNNAGRRMEVKEFASTQDRKSTRLNSSHVKTS